MANKSLFASLKSRFVRADTRNEAGGRAYTLEPKHALAQLAATGCFNGTYYAQADEQLATLKTLVDQVTDIRVSSHRIRQDNKTRRDLGRFSPRKPRFRCLGSPPPSANDQDRKYRARHNTETTGAELAAVMLCAAGTRFAAALGASITPGGQASSSRA